MVGQIIGRFFCQTLCANNFLLGKKSLVKSTLGLRIQTPFVGLGFGRCLVPGLKVFVFEKKI